MKGLKLAFNTWFVPRYLAINPDTKRPIGLAWQLNSFGQAECDRRLNNNPNMVVGLLLGPSSSNPTQKNGSDLYDFECDDPGSQETYDKLFADPVTGEIPRTATFNGKRGLHYLYRRDPRLAGCLAAFHVGPEAATVECRLGERASAQSICPPSTIGGYTRNWLPGLSPDEIEIPFPPEHVVQFLFNHKPARASTFRVDDEYGDPIIDSSDPLAKMQAELQDKVVREIREFFEREPNPILTSRGAPDHRGTVKIGLDGCPHKLHKSQEVKDGGPVVFVNSDGTFNFSCKHKLDADKQDWESVEAALGKKLYESLPELPEPLSEPTGDEPTGDEPTGDSALDEIDSTIVGFTAADVDEWFNSPLFKEAIDKGSVVVIPPKVKSDEVIDDFNENIGERFVQRLLAEEGWKRNDDFYTKVVDGDTKTIFYSVTPDGTRFIRVDTELNGCKAGSYRLFDAYAILKHDGDTAKASSAVKKMGFGGLRMASLNSHDLVANDRKINYLIEDVLIEGKPFMGFGQSKSLKTLLTVDMATSLATMTAFLGRFKVNRPCSVLFMSGESGLDVLRKRFIAICKARGVDPLKDANLLTWSAFLPRVGDEIHLKCLRRELNKCSAEVAIIDPAYLAMDGDNASNVVKQGECLRRLQDVCGESGALPLILHHAVKMKGRDTYRPLELTDMAFAGFAEWARQWMGIGRVEPYILGSGQHQLYVSFSSNDAQAGTFVVDVDEGTKDEPKWEVKIQTKEQWDELPTAPPTRHKHQIETFRKKVVEALLKADDEGDSVYRTLHAAHLTKSKLHELWLNDMMKDGLITRENKVVRGRNVAYIRFTTEQKEAAQEAAQELAAAKAAKKGGAE